jgi:hypothetical protein
MDTARWGAVWARLSGADRVAQIDCFQKRISEVFVPATADEAEAIWRFLHRSGDIDGALDALSRSPAGIECVRTHVLAGRGGAHDEAIRKQFAELLLVDRETLAPGPGEELPAMLARLKRCGLAGDWTEAERQQLLRLRALRGVGEVGGG